MMVEMRAEPVLHAMTTGAMAPQAEGKEPLPATVYITLPRHGLSVNLAPVLPRSDTQKRFADGGSPGRESRGFHGTGSIDIIVARDDGLELLVEAGTAKLQAGDAAIQRNTLHGRRNLSDRQIRQLGITAGL